MARANVRSRRLRDEKVRPDRGRPGSPRPLPNALMTVTGGPTKGSPLQRLVRRTEADHWSFLFAQITLHSFIVLLATGAFLTFFFDPDMARTTYEGSYGPLRGVEVSKAYESTLHLSLEVRGGLLMRQVHHWAALIFTAAICCQILRMFFTGAFRSPRRLNWLIWVGMLTLAMAAGVTGTVLPDDMLSGGSLSLIQGVTQSIPVIGTGVTFLLFGADIPGDDIIPRLYWAHILLVPAAIAALFPLRRLLITRFGHTRFPGSPPAGRRRGLRSVALLLYTCGVLVLLGTLAQINPIWLYGPYEPGAISAGAVPDWYMGFLDGAVRIMPGWEITVAGHPITLAVLVPALLVPGAFFTALAAYPWIERRFTGDRRLHHVLDRPRDHAFRTGLGAAGIAFYGLLWAAAANDQIADTFHLSLFAVTGFFRIAVLIGPVVVFAITRWICLALVAREWQEVEHGYETGRIVMTADGAYSEIHAPVHGPDLDRDHDQDQALEQGQEQAQEQGEMPRPDLEGGQPRRLIRQ
ncbi:cytochrome bc complex cytochrome b subunit [Actinomadura sp. 9N407]|uniref:cytochrome bc1 complex cytochrome b subunit n=1 Tax=Actinomadura sp. 9N407 TaxID=3375154 RepID=UPI00379CAAB1